MRSFSLPVILLAALLSLSLWTGAFTRKNVDRCTGLLAQAESDAMAHRWSSAADRLQDAMDSWESRRRILRIFLDHQQLDQIEALFSSAMAACLQKTEEEEFYPLLSQLDTQLRLLAEAQELSLHNVL